MKKITFIIFWLLIYCVFLAVNMSFASEPIDLRGWTAHPGGNWVVSSDGSSVLQTVNGNPTLFVSDTDYINTTFEGSFVVETTSDDDYIGFVFGFNDENDYLLFDWKQGSQNYSGGYGYKGFTLSRISGSNVNFWTHTGSDIEVLATNYTSDNGWKDYVLYNFKLVYQENRIQILINNQVIFDISGVFKKGKFGFYNYSQAYVRYQGFENETTTPNVFGDIIKVQNEYSIIVEQYKKENFIIQVMNSGDISQSISLELLNPLTELPIEIATTYIQLGAGDVVDILLEIDASIMPLGTYDDMLLKITTESGEILYSNLKITITEHGTKDQPDLRIDSDDIELTNCSPGISGTIQAVVHNSGRSPSSNVSVMFYEMGTSLGQVILDDIPAGGTATATLTLPISSLAGERLIQVVIDPGNTIAELSEVNNQASRVITWGETGPAEGYLLVTGSLPTRVYPGKLFTLSGHAAYDLTVDGVRYTDYVVKGGAVQVTISDNDGHEWIYGGIHTNINGNFLKRLQAPEPLGTYRVSMTVSDKTFIGKRELVFQVVECPETPELPPLPPAVFGPGEWIPGPNGPIWEPGPGSNHPQSDLWIYSDDIYFSNPHPDPDEEITLFAQLHYWATSTDPIENVPVNFYVTYPGTPRVKVGETLISSLSVGAPDFGSRYVYASWKNRSEGIYIVEVAIDPNYIEEKMLNNAATRAIIVGNLPSTHGVIQGQVTDGWGGVGNVILELYENGGTTLFGSTLTDNTGHYLFESIPAGQYQVRISAPPGLQADAVSKTTQVIAQEISDVDFLLTVQVLFCGDLDHDGDVDGDDRTIIRGAFRAVEGDDGYISEADYDKDGDIDYSDYQVWYDCYQAFIED